MTQRTMRRISAILGVFALLAAGLAGAAAGQSSPSCTPTPAGGNLCVLNPTVNRALEVESGTTRLSVANNIVVNSSARGNTTSAAAYFGNGATTAGGTIGVVGNASIASGATVAPTPTDGIAPEPDPFAGATVPGADCSAPAMTVPSGNPATLNPGTYNNVTADGRTLYLSPGVYTITGELKTGGSAGRIVGDGVTLYFCPGAKMTLDGGGGFTLSAPGGPTHFAIFWASTNDLNIRKPDTAANPVEITGVIYAPNARLYVHNAHMVVTGDVVVNRASVGSGANLTIKEGTAPNGSLVVRKTVTGPAAGERGTIRISVECANTPLEDFVIPPGGALERTYPDIPAGTPCAVTEIPEDGSTSTVDCAALPFDGRATIPASGGTAAVEITNDCAHLPLHGSLLVRKTVTGPAAGERGLVRIEVACGGVRLPDFVIPARRGTGTFSRRYEVPAGTRCTVTETVNGHTSTVDVVVTISPRNGRVTIRANSTARVAITNNYTLIPGKLTVTKTIDGPAGGQRGTVRIAVTCGGDPLDDFVIAADEGRGTFSKTYSNIPAGTECAIARTAEDGSTSAVAVTPGGSGGTVTIPANGTAALAMTNTYTSRPGSLIVTKTITGPAEGQQGEIVIGVTCTGSAPLPDFIILPGVTGTRDTSYPDIPAGSTCTVTEMTNGHTSTATVAVTGGGETVVPAGGTGTLGLTDTVSSAPGTLVLNKTITGPAAGRRGAVTIELECNGTRLPDFTIPAGAAAGTTSHTYSGLPAGATCTVTESPDGHTNTVRVTVTGDRQVTIPSNGGATASLVDTYTGVPGKLRVEKTIAGPGAGRQGDVRIQVSCDGQRLPDFVVLAGTPAGTRSHTYENVPAGAICTLSEPEDGHTSTIVVTVTGDGRQVTIPANGTATATIRDDYTLIPGSLTVRKTVTGPAAGARGSIRVEVTCGGVRLPDFVIAVDMGRGTFSHTYGNIPAGTTCTVSETENGRTSTIAIRVAGDGQQARIPANAIANAELTVTYLFAQRRPPGPPRFTG